MMKRTTMILGGTFTVAVAGLSVALAAQQTGPESAAQAMAQSASAVAAEAESFKIDPVHSSVVFRIQHTGVSYFYGTFNEMFGTYKYDAGDPASSNFDITVNTDSVDSRNGRRDGHLKSPDFFNASEFPKIAFKSTGVEGSGDTLHVTGDLNLHGVTKSITVDMNLVGHQDTPMGNRSGFETTFTIKRTDFGMDTYVAEGGLGDEVKLFIGIEGVKQ